MKAERRKTPRFHLDQLIQIGPFRESYVQARGLNISENGLLCETGEPCDVYQQVYAQISFDIGKQHRTIECDGIVLRNEKHGGKWKVAINFEDLSDESRSVVKSFTKKKKSA